jgi:hypothetical protein
MPFFHYNTEIIVETGGKRVVRTTTPGENGKSRVEITFTHKKLRRGWIKIVSGAVWS